VLSPSIYSFTHIANIYSTCRSLMPAITKLKFHYMLLYTDMEGSRTNTFLLTLLVSCRCRMWLFAMLMFGRGRMLSGSCRRSTARTA
jgi:hypothetical protein